MRSNQCASLAASILTLLVFNNFASAQYTDYQWIGGAGSHDWQVDANWDLGIFPNEIDPLDMEFPTANLSVGVGGNLNVNIGATPVTVAGISMGGAAGPVTTEISSTNPAGRLTFRNDFQPDFSNTRDADFDNNGMVMGRDFLIWQRNYGFVNPGQDVINNRGDANRDNVVNGLDLEIWQDQYGFGAQTFTEGNAFLLSGGVAGSVNRITAPIHIDNDAVQIAAMNPLLIDTGADITSSSATGTASLSVVSGVVTINSDIILTDSDGDPLTTAIELNLNSSGRTAGTLILNGDIRVPDPSVESGIRLGGGDGRIELYGNNEVTGTVITGGPVILLGNDRALGVSPTDPNDVARVRPGGTFYSNDDQRNIPNNFLLTGDFNFAGDHSITLSGLITQTNNDGIVNDIGNGKVLTIDGTLAIWGDDDTSPEREFDFEGTGKTIITGEITAWDPQVQIDNPDAQAPAYAGLNKGGTGVLVIDVEAGKNNHSGYAIVRAGNMHYATNNSLNTGLGLILSYGGAVGVDSHPAGQTLANNADFLNQISPDSNGGLMLATSDTATNLDFTTGPLANAANMSVAAPETGLAYTGTITPANGAIKLGGGEGKLTLPNATLTGTYNVEIRNGSTVALLGDNTYTGSTTLIKGSPTLEVDHLADGGVASSIGQSTSDAANLFIQGATLKYVGPGDSTNRLFTVGTRGATVDSSGSGALVFTNTGAIAVADVTDHIGTLDDFTGVPNVIINVDNTDDIVAGMTVSDPDPGGPAAAACGGGTSTNCIPAGTTVTGISADGKSLGLSNSFGFVWKMDTRLVFGNVERTLTLTGDNTDDNTIAGAISDSPAGGVVSLMKTGPGMWRLTGNNSYSGSTTVEEGILSITSAFLNSNSTVNMVTGGILDLDFVGENAIDGLFFDGTAQSNGLWGAPGNALAQFTSPFFTGSGLLSVGSGALVAASQAVPEPGSLLLISTACIAGIGRHFFRNTYTTSSVEEVTSMGPLMS